MYRGTTPTIKCQINSDIDLTDIEQVWVTFKNKSYEKTYDIEEVEIDTDENTISLVMTQEDTLAFHTCGELKGKVAVQIRLLTTGGLAMASNVAEITLEGTLKEGVIE